MFSGARIEEVCQLAIDDVKCENGIWLIDINENADWKSLKTAAATRKVPLHPKLIETGLLDYVHDLKTGFPKEKRLFPYLIPNKFGNHSSASSKWFFRYLTAIGITDELKVFHSFRSTFNNMLKSAGVNEETRSEIVGHAHNSINSKHYSNNYDPKWLLDNVMLKLNFDALDLNQFKYV